MEYTKQDYIEAVAACLAGAATDEQRALAEQWKDSSEKNRALWERLNDKKALGKKMAELDLTDIQKGWRKLEQRMDSRRVRRKRFGAAAVWAAAVVGCVLLIQLKDNGKSPAVASGDGPVTTAGAELILADGSVVPIGEVENMEIHEGAGTTIYKDSHHIDYSRNTAEGVVELIYNEIRIQNGMSYTMTLSDGTQVFMNAESRLRFPVKFSDAERLVKFEGEAYFSVAKNADSPFIIKTGDLEVAVLGTEFNLRAYKDETEIVTTLVSGKVQVRDEENTRDIAPGEQVVYKTGTGEFSTRAVDVDFYTAWCRSEIMFKDSRLDDIMKDLSRWYGIEYEFMDDNAASLILGGSFKRTDTIKPILDMIGKTGLVDVIWSDNKIYFSTENR